MTTAAEVITFLSQHAVEAQAAAHPKTAQVYKMAALLLQCEEREKRTRRITDHGGRHVGT